jgi:hypothetical protein
VRELGEQRDAAYRPIERRGEVAAGFRQQTELAAEAWSQKSLAIDEALSNRPGMATSYHQLGIVAQDRGDLATAEAWYQKALAILEALADRPGMALTYGQLGRVA